MTLLPLFDGTFSTDAVADAGLALLDQLHDEAMATIAALAENWDRPAGAEVQLVEDDEATTWSDPETWSAEDDDLEHDLEHDLDDDLDADQGRDDEVRRVPLSALPSLLPLRPHRAAAVPAPAVADARQYAAV